LLCFRKLPFQVRRKGRRDIEFWHQLELGMQLMRRREDIGIIVGRSIGLWIACAGGATDLGIGRLVSCLLIVAVS
jgi:hypothetical protein